MGVHWDAAFTRWWPHKEGEKIFSLAHLHPFTFTVEVPPKPPHPRRVAHIQAGFSMRRQMKNKSTELLLVVRSAHSKLSHVWAETQLRTPVSFNVLLAHALKGTTPKAPP